MKTTLYELSLNPVALSKNFIMDRIISMIDCIEVYTHPLVRAEIHRDFISNTDIILDPIPKINEAGYLHLPEVIIDYHGDNSTIVEAIENFMDIY